jgi:limonene-1,2-epoxide hydrolase
MQVMTMAAVTCVALAAVPMTVRAQARANEQVVLDFFAAWSRLDPAEIASFFTEDGVYHNMPSPQGVQGRANIERFIGGFAGSWTETSWEVLRIMSSGDVVIAERVDRTRAGDKSVDLPVMGVFEMEGGKIKVWRDYFDLATYTRGMS